MRITMLFASILLLAGCNQPQEQGSDETAEVTPAQEADGEAGDTAPATGVDAEPTPDATPTPEELAMTGTAWRVVGEDGAIYTTFLDAEGEYRDMKNGDPWAEGTWERLADGRLCFTPSDEDRAGGCWSLGKHNTDGSMRVTSDAGREIELQQVTYLAPANGDEG
jgi:hypothetical protein